MTFTYVTKSASGSKVAQVVERQEEDHQRAPVHVHRIPRPQEHGKQTAGSWQGSDTETLKCNHESTRRGSGERSTISVKKASHHSGSPCVTNLFVNCFSGAWSLVGSRTRIHQACGRRWATASVPEAPNGKCDMIVDEQSLNQTRTRESGSSQYVPCG